MINRRTSDHHGVENLESPLSRPLGPAPIPDCVGELTREARARLRAMFDAHYDFVWRLLRRVGVPAAAVDDAAQEVFVVAMRRQDCIRAGSERSFLFGIALRIASDRRRATARGHELPDDRPEMHETDVPGADELLDERRARQMLDQVLDAMADELRTVFVLYELDGLTTKEIAELCQIPAGTAASRLRRAREEFGLLVQRIKARQRARGGAS